MELGCPGDLLIIRKHRSGPRCTAYGRSGLTSELIRSLVDEIRLVPEEGRLRIEVHGELSSILALAGGAENAQGEYRRTAIAGGGRRGAIKVHGEGDCA